MNTFVWDLDSHTRFTKLMSQLKSASNGVSFGFCNAPSEEEDWDAFRKSFHEAIRESAGAVAFVHYHDLNRFSRQLPKDPKLAEIAEDLDRTLKKHLREVSICIFYSGAYPYIRSDEKIDARKCVPTSRWYRKSLQSSGFPAEHLRPLSEWMSRGCLGEVPEFLVREQVGAEVAAELFLALFVRSQAALEVFRRGGFSDTIARVGVSRHLLNGGLVEKWSASTVRRKLGIVRHRGYWRSTGETSFQSALATLLSAGGGDAIKIENTLELLNWIEIQRGPSVLSAKLLAASFCEQLELSNFISDRLEIA